MKRGTVMKSRAGLYRRENDVLAFRYKDKDGRWREKYTGKTRHAEARRFKREFEDNLASGTLPTEKANWTVKQGTSRWVEQHAVHLNSEKAKRNEQSLLRQLTKRLGHRKLNSIKLDDLKDYQQKRRKEVGARAINLELQILVSVLKEANLWAAIGGHYKRLKEAESEIGQALSVEQLHLFEATAATNDAWEVAYSSEVLAANTGLRGGEIKKMRLSMLDLEKRRITVTRKSTKSNAGARLVELNQAASAAACKLYMRAQMLGASHPDHYLLPADLSRHTKNTDPLKGGRGFDPTKHQTSWRTAWRSLRKAAGDQIVETAKKEDRDLTAEERDALRVFQSVRFHDLRHTFITMMGERGVPLQVVQAMVGHMSPRMVRYYTHISNRAAREAVELLDNASRGPFVGKLVGKTEGPEESNSKLLN
jgi:integrase